MTFHAWMQVTLGHIFFHYSPSHLHEHQTNLKYYVYVS